MVFIPLRSKFPDGITEPDSYDAGGFIQEKKPDESIGLFSLFIR